VTCLRASYKGLRGFKVRPPSGSDGNAALWGLNGSAGYADRHTGGAFTAEHALGFSLPSNFS
jgi:hypothetical protein